MQWHFTIYAAILSVSTIIGASVAVLVWQRRAVHGGATLAVLMLAASIYAGASTLEAAAVGIPAKIFWSKVQYLGSMTCSPLLLVFALDYARCERWFNWRTVAAAFVIPIITIGLAWTNEAHGLIWTGFQFSEVGENLLIYQHGPAFWIAVVYSYVAVAAATVVLLRNVARSIHVYRHQLIAVVIAIVAAWSGSIMYVFTIGPLPGFDWASLSFALTGAALAWGITRYQLFDLVPVTREAVVESMPDGVIVLDLADRIVDINRAALALIGLSHRPIGQSADTVFAAQPDLIERFRQSPDVRVEVIVDSPPAPRYLDINSSPLFDRRGRLTGRLLVLRDVTDRKQAEQAVQASESHLRQIIDLVPNFIFAKDAEGRFVLVNQALATAYGTTVEELIGKTDADFARSGEEARHFHEDDLAVIRSGRPLTIPEESITTAMGEVHYLQTTKIPFKLFGSDQAALLGVAVDITDRRQAEDALITSEALYHTLVETLPVNIFRKDLTGRFTYANQRFCRSQNKPLSDIIGKTDFDLHPSELAEKYRADDRRIIDTGQTFDIDESYQPLDGEVSWVHTLKTPQYAPDGRISGVQGMFWDVTERKRAEDVIAQRTREMAALYETALDINTQIDLHPLLHAIVRRAAELLGARMGGLHLVRPDRQGVELVVGHNLPGDLIGTQLKLGEGLAGQIAQTGETLMVEDYAAWLGRAEIAARQPLKRILGVPLKIGGRVIGVINVIDDQHAGRFTDDQVRLASLLADHAAIAIEKVRLLDETLQRAERLALLNRIARAIGSTLNLNDLMEIIHREITRVMAAEAFFVALYDDQTNELDFRIRVDRDVREPAERRPLQEGITGLVVTRRQPLLIRDFEREKDQLPPARIWGTMQPPPSVVCVPMLLGEKVVGVISVQAYRPYAFDEAELELLTTIADTVAVAVDNARLFDASRHHAEDLEQRVAARTLELTRAYEHLQDLDRLKDEFVSRISHELRTPIANIQLYQGLLEHGKPDKHAEYLQTLQRETTRLNKLIEDLLAISRLDLGQTSINLVPIDVNRLVANLQPDWHTAANERGLRFEVVRAHDLPPALADLPLLTRAASNLVSNAFNYTPRGGTVGLCTDTRTLDEVRWAIVTVRDTGPGLGLDELPHVFERFYRGRAARNYKVPGTGLGLAMCKEIMDKLGGRVTVQSTEGQGATFTLWLPLA
ncbi:MAG: PAS domain-containing protein [Chloroflexi bacterium]|nr:PAS domain-containing protein [Chloroflexota bacterium]